MRVPSSPEAAPREPALQRGYKALEKLVDTHFWPILSLGLLCNFFLCLFVIDRVAYTEIDWVAYMQEVAGVLEHNEYDYMKLRGDTGPLVYPAGFVWLYALLYRLTNSGALVRRAQMLFAVLHTATVGVAAYILRHALRPAPPLALAALFLSRRAISLFVLRLFNDGPQTLLTLASIALMLHNNWSAACVVYSLALSVKMNALLYAPALALLLCQARGPLGALWRAILLIGAPQLVLAVPFLRHAPRSYANRAFELSRVFEHRWSVNGAMLSERAFQSKRLAVALLVAHLGTLLLFGHFKWTEQGTLGLFGLVGVRKRDGRFAIELCGTKRRLRARHVAGVLFTCNFVGIVFARTLHYQFYAWYVYSLPFLVCFTDLHAVVKTVLLFAVEIVFNVYPPTSIAAVVLHACHFILLDGLAAVPRAEGIYETADERDRKDR